ncbi:MAG TPA: hypothetical protein VGG97_05775 [Bryobacteraceae bacterium]|jgi:hypothetical protein
MDTLTNAQNVDVSNYVPSTQATTDRGTSIAPVNPQPKTAGGRSISFNTNGFLASGLNQAQNAQAFNRVTGASGTFKSADGKTVTVKFGLIVLIA